MSARVKQTPNINPHVSVDCVIFGFDDDKLKVLLIEQAHPNKKSNRLALPGDLVFENEGLDQAAARVLEELTQLKGIFLRQFHAFGNPNRVSQEKDKEWLMKHRTDPNARVITIAYYSLVKMEEYAPGTGSFAAASSWIDIHSVPELAFDHNLILDKALEALREEISQDRISIDLLPKKFTLSQLQRLYEVILDRPLDKRNFRKSIKKMEHLKALDERQTGVSHKPAQLYKFVPTKKETM